jgi:hypothetical protein
MKLNGELHALTALSPENKSPKNPVPETSPEDMAERKDSLPVLGIEPRFLGRPYRLS